MIRSLNDFAPRHVEAGTGLILHDEEERYLFFLAGSRHQCPEGELFYAGIGGHREENEDWITCARREAQEEVGSDIEIISASKTWYVPQGKSIEQLQFDEEPRPFALYEMIHPPHTPNEGEIYRIVIFKAQLLDMPQDLPPDEVRGVIALTETQVIDGVDQKVSLGELLKSGAKLVVGGDTIDPKTRLYPIGTARALGLILKQARQLRSKQL